MSSRDGEKTAQMSAADKEFQKILQQEYCTVLSRRKNGKERGPDQREKSADGLSPPADLFGVALSGGGIRSASFCLGVLQALDARGLIDRMDYLSTVSGGGYVGASMVAAMSRTDTAGKFPFSCAGRQPDQIRWRRKTEGEDHGQSAESSPDEDPDRGENHGKDKDHGKAKRPDAADVEDSEPVSHLRDHSRYLIPRGAVDILPTLAVWARGLAVNVLLVLVLIVPLATLFILFNPTVADLKCGIVCLGPSAHPWIAAFPASLGLMLATVLWLLVWGIYRSLPERHGCEMKSFDELQSKGVQVSKFFFALTAAAVIWELQKPVLSYLYDFLNANDAQGSVGTFMTAAGAAVASVAGLRGVLLHWIQKASGSEALGLRLRAFASRLAFLAAGVVVPAFVYLAFLLLTSWGIALGPDGGYPLAPWLVKSSVLCKLLVLSSVVMLAWTVYVFVWRPSGRKKLQDAWKLLSSNWSAYRVLAYLALIVLIVLLAGRAVQLRSGMSSEVWQMMWTWLLASATVYMLALNLAENANALHRLYRERLSTAFRLGNTQGPMPLSEIDVENAPYLLINTTLNTRQQSRRKAAQEDEKAEQTQKIPLVRSHDPAKRGRNAEFFIFSQMFVGSALTGHLKTSEVEALLPGFDLAAAVAISGAAVSSSMGRLNLGLLRPTLALLNLRLGYWFPNPWHIKKDKENSPPPLRWYDFCRAYLLVEALGLLSADASRIYLTDGGHLENLGLYALLKRKCRLIIVADAEADPNMTFDALVDVQRFARIDLGVRIKIDFQHLRDAALKRNKARRGQRAEAHDANQHVQFAVGRIDYGGGEPEGVLIYVKACVMGTEPDYVLAYERRHASFPHETTGDQFFSEEQMEAYRALGFHAMRSALQAVAEIDGFKGMRVDRDGPAAWHQSFRKRLGLIPEKKPGAAGEQA